MPWQSILSELNKLDKESVCQKAPDIPKSGEELASVVQVLLKASDVTKRSKLPQFIHQAFVRRDKVIDHILRAKERGHRAYIHVNEADVRRKAASLPKNDVPQAIIRLLPYDNHLNKIVIQKAATPVDLPSCDMNKVAKNLALQRPNAVVMEKT
eukprot:2797355-Karenia_brevis.AAC.1